MVKNLGRKIKEWVAIRLPLLWLALSIFLTSYFPAISRYNFNTLFNSAKRGYFNFFFTGLQLKGKQGDSWIRWFGVVILACYTLRVVARALLVFCEKQARQNFKKITDEKFALEGSTGLTQSLSNRVVSDFVAFFSCFCELLIDLWAVISINRMRAIEGHVMLKTLFCSLVMIWTISTVKATIEKKKESWEKLGFSSLLAEAQQQLVFPELGTIFTALYFLFFPENTHVIDAILLGFNISSVFNKLRRFVLVVPRIVSTYRIWRKVGRAPNEDYILADYDVPLSDL